MHFVQSDFFGVTAERCERSVPGRRETRDARRPGAAPATRRRRSGKFSAWSRPAPRTPRSGRRCISAPPPWRIASAGWWAGSARAAARSSRHTRSGSASR